MRDGTLDQIDEGRYPRSRLVFSRYWCSQDIGIGDQDSQDIGDRPCVGLPNNCSGLTHLDLHHQRTWSANGAIPEWDPGFTRHELFTKYGYSARPIPLPSLTRYLRSLPRTVPADDSASKRFHATVIRRAERVAETSKPMQRSLRACW